LPIDAPTQLIRKPSEEVKLSRPGRLPHKELEVLSEEDESPVPSNDHKLLFGSKVKPVRQADKVTE